VSDGTDVGVGDPEVAFLTIAPADNSTTATLTVEKPDGTSSAVAVSGGTLTAIPDTSPVQYSQRWTSDQSVVYDAPGRWVLHWAVTGTGQGTEDLEVYVVASPVAGGPTWLPGRSRVAAYVPHRTLARSVTSTIESADTYAWTFDSTTTPPGTTVDRLIMDGADWVTALVTPLNVKVQPLSALVCALWAAIAVERGWPDDDTSLQRANDMEKQLNTMLAQLKTANTAANTTDGTDSSPPAVQPVWSFPCPDRRWDYPGYW
jgi:hypothetical protein